MDKALVIDGNSLIYRFFYATLKQMEYYTANGSKPKNAVKLFLLVLLKLISVNNYKEYKYVYITFDHKKKNDRHDVYAEYKAGRKPMPQELVDQLPDIMDVIEACNICHESKEGVEADDLIGSFSRLMAKNNVDVEIYSSDKDMLQLVSDLVNVNLLKTGISDIKRITKLNFGENFFDLLPSQVNDFKGISGDSSDNLTGVNGIGPVQAVKLIKEFNSLEGIYDNITKLTKSQQEKFINSKENALMCKKLSIINCDIFADRDINDFLFSNINNDKLWKIVKENKFTSIEKYLTVQTEQSLF